MKKIEILGSKLIIYDNNSLLNLISESIKFNKKISITYYNFSTFNINYKNTPLKNIFNSFDFIHTDGIGIFLAIKLLFGNNYQISRINGSDFYPILISEGIKNEWRIFFFGDTDDTLKRIHNENSQLNIVGANIGYNYINDNLISMINNSHPDILIVGLGQPKQEQWIIKNKLNLQVKIIIAVGDGIKVFAGNKIRGPKIFRILGLEWLIRLISNPLLYWKRYLIGIPLFLFRILKIKFQLIFNKKNYHFYENH